MYKYLIVLLLFVHINIGFSQRPVLHFSFDELKESQLNDSIVGQYSIVEGISGKAIQTDGYTTEIFRKPDGLFFPKQSFTIDAWIAPQEYSWNQSAIINQQRDNKEGFFFGINFSGKLIGSVASETGWVTCTTDKSIELLKWTYVAMTFDPKAGISLYINGKLSGQCAFSGTPVMASNVKLCIGKTQYKMAPAYTERASSKASPSWMYFDGLIDEIHVFDKIILEKEIGEIFNSVRVNQPKPLNFRKMPSGPIGYNEFGAFYTKLSYSPGWDLLWKGSDYPDVVVTFENKPVKLIFWRGTGYIPAFVSENGIWMSDQSLENFGTGECYEAMGDKNCRYSNVRILESSPARCVIHWRHALAGIKHSILHENTYGWGDWADEYWTVYPDGVAIRKQVLHSDFFEKEPGSFQFQETIFFNQPGTKPQDNVDLDAIAFLDMDGNKAAYSWAEGAPKNFDKTEFQPIQLVNFKSKYKPFGIYTPDRVTFPFSFGWVEGYSTFPCWNHWPVAQIPSDGRNAVAPDKPSHSSLTQVNGDHQVFEKGPDNTFIARSIAGMTMEPIDSLLSLAKSWNFPANITIATKGFLFQGYDKYQRSYIIESITKDSKQPLQLTVHATKQQPVSNLVFILKNWSNTPSVVDLDGNNLNPSQYRIGLRQLLEGNQLILWISVKSAKDLNVKIIP